MEPLQTMMDTIGIHEDENKGAYECTYCEETFTDQNYLKVHLLSHKEYQNLKRIFQGQENYSEEDKYDELFDSIADKIDIHNEIKEETDEDSVMGKNENKEIKKASEDKIHKCKHCEKTFTEDRNLKRHIQTVHEGRKDYECNQCHNFFVSKQVLERHIQNKHHNAGYKKNKSREITDDEAVITKIENPWNVDSIYEFYYYNCPTCSYKQNSDSKQDFFDHLLNIHPESTEYLRNISDGSLSDVLTPWNKNEYEGNFEEEISIRDDLKVELKDDFITDISDNITNYENQSMDYYNSEQHIDEQKDNIKIKSEPKHYDNGGSKKGHKCEICDNSFYYPSDLKKHIHTVHEGHKEYKCQSCGKSFSQPGSLKLHINAVHGSHQNYKCESCGKSFSESGTLRKHIHYIHEGHKDYKCESCDKSFSQAWHLKKHIHTIHQGHKDHKCESFSHDHNLKKHVHTIHAGHNAH